MLCKQGGSEWQEGEEGQRGRDDAFGQWRGIDWSEYEFDFKLDEDRRYKCNLCQFLKIGTRTKIIVLCYTVYASAKSFLVNTFTKHSERTFK